MSLKIPITGLARRWRLKRRAAKVAASPLFDATWYLNQNPDVREAGMDPALHYLATGAAEGRWPNPLFDPEWYGQQFDGPASPRQSLRQSIRRLIRQSPLEHYLLLPVEDRPGTHPLFDPRWYLSQNPDVAESGIDPLAHFLERGGREGHSPYPGFDAAWYLASYPDIAKADINPLVHFLAFGAQEGRKPGPWFDTAWYRETHLRADRADCNPLVHYVRFGRREGLEIRPAPARSLWWDSHWRNKVACGRSRAREVADALRRAGRAAGVTVVIPVYNAPEALEDCLAAVTRHTPRNVRVVVIDDASTEPAVKTILDSHQSGPRFEILQNNDNRGYTATVNRGIERADRDDVVLLNADTRVGPGWLRRLRLSAYSVESVATATALSNNAGAFSAPETNRSNPLPEGLSPAQFARAIAQAAQDIRPATPTGSGFCMYIRRDCLDQVGKFDEQAFPRGYGEENDFCMRALRKNRQHVVDDSVFVFHHRSASFGSQRAPLVEQGMQVVNERYPDYAGRVAEFLGSAALKQARRRIADIAKALKVPGSVVKPRMLYVIAALHEDGGTWLTNRDLMDGLAGDYETMLLRCDGKLLELFSYRAGELVLLDYAVLRSPIRAFPHTSEEYDAIVAQWLHEHAIELIHVRHIALHGLGLFDIARRMWIPVVFSFHDYYTICPTVKLLDENLKFCGGHCTATKGHCTPELWPDEDVPELKHGAVADWKKMFSAALENCDALVTTCESVRELVCSNFPALRESAFHVIPHGRDFPEFLPPPAAPGDNEALRVLFPGNLTRAKGADAIAALAGNAAECGLDIHILGRWLAGAPPPGVVVHRSYARAEFTDRVREIRPHIGGVLSIWPETWCHTLTELWAAGLPVAGSNLGAVGERIQATGAGWPVAQCEPGALVELFGRIRQDPEEYAQKTGRVRAWQEDEGRARDCAGMARQYRAVYASLAPAGQA